MKFDNLVNSILNENIEEYLPGQWIGNSYIIIGRDEENPGNYNVAEIGEQDVYPAAELEDTGTTLGGDRIMKWSHTGEDVIVFGDKNEDEDYVGVPIEGAFSATAAEVAELEDEEGGEY